MSEQSDRIRKEFGEGDAKRDAGLTTPEDVIRYDDIQYGPVEGWQLLDVYRPKACSGKKLPVIVSFHGGGWVYGTKEVYQFYCMSLAQRGFAVVNYTYRLAPEYKFPAPFEDINLVFEWIYANAEEYGLDTDNLFAVGDSAGGHGIALYAAFCTNDEYASKFDFKKPEGMKLRAVALNCGLYDPIKRAEAGQEDTILQDYLPDHGTPEEMLMICVPEHVTKDFPPAFVMTATDDFLKDEAPVIMAKFDELHVPYEYKLYGTDEKPLWHVFHCDMRLKEAAICNDDECNFFKKYIV